MRKARNRESKRNRREEKREGRDKKKGGRDEEERAEGGVQPGPLCSLTQSSLPRSMKRHLFNEQDISMASSGFPSLLCVGSGFSRKTELIG